MICCRMERINEFESYDCYTIYIAVAILFSEYAPVVVLYGSDHETSKQS